MPIACDQRLPCDPVLHYIKMILETKLVWEKLSTLELMNTKMLLNLHLRDE